MAEQCATEVNDFWSSIFWIVAHGQGSTPNEIQTVSFLIKTLVPISITVILALLTYSVARNQRTIAKNKYNLDLFDRRLKEFTFFKEGCLKVQYIYPPYAITYNKVENRDPNNILSTLPIEEALFNCTLLFPSHSRSGKKSPLLAFKESLDLRKEEMIKISQLKSKKRELDDERSFLKEGDVKEFHLKVKSNDEDIKNTQNSIFTRDNNFSKMYNECVSFML